MKSEETVWQGRRRSHGVPTDPLERLFLHGNEGTEASPAGIPLAVSEIFGKDDHVAGGACGSGIEDCDDLGRAVSGRSAYEYSTVRSDGGNDISGAGRKDEQIRCELSDLQSAGER